MLTKGGHRYFNCGSFFQFQTNECRIREPLWKQNQKLSDIIHDLTCAGNRVQSDKLALRTVLKDIGVISTLGDDSTDAWINAKEWDRKEDAK